MIEWGLRFMNVVVILIQLRVIHSPRGRYCANQLGVLNVEARWIHVITGVTLAKVIVFGLW